MNAYSQGFQDIPGTTVFDTTKSRIGYHLNMFCMALVKPENRAEFKADEAAYLEKFALTAEQKAAILARDYNRMIELGANVFFLAKLCSTDAKPVIAMVADMSGVSLEEYSEMMLRGGRPIEGNRHTLEWINNG
jgi:protocatechuate 4,5-dioxygenase alpha chain